MKNKDNVVQIYSSFISYNKEENFWELYFVFEKLNGPTLKSFLKAFQHEEQLALLMLKFFKDGVLALKSLASKSIIVQNLSSDNFVLDILTLCYEFETSLLQDKEFFEKIISGDIQS